MKIVHLYDGHEKVHRGKGSLPRIIWNIARRSADRGHDVTVIERQWKGLPRTATHTDVSFRRLRLRTGSMDPWNDVPYEMVQSRTGLARLFVDRTNFALHALPVLRRIDYDVVHCYLPFAANVLVTIAPWLRPRLVYTAQLGELRLNSLSEDETAELNAPGFLDRFSPDIYLAHRTAKTTVLNEHVRDIFVDNGLEAANVVHIPNGVELTTIETYEEADRDRVRRTYDLGYDPIILFVGTVMPRKGVTHLVEAVGRLVNEGNPVQLVIAGESDLDDAYRREVETLISEAGMDDLVTFTGYIEDPDLVPLYQLADVFVLPSFEEGFGMVVSEAMAAGTPVVASDISGIRQQVDDEITGLLVPPGDSRALQTALRRMVTDDDLREAMGERSRQKAQQFSWERVTDQYLDLYRTIGAPFG